MVRFRGAGAEEPAPEVAGRAGPTRRLVLGGLVAVGGGTVAIPLVDRWRRGHRHVAKKRAKGWSVARENRLAGTDAWQLAKRGAPEAIAGFADKVSVRPGEPFQIFVSTTARSFQVTAFRMGWYGGKRGREIWRSAEIKGAVQAAPVVAKGVNMVTAPWGPSATVQTHGWPEGCYLLKLTSDEGYEQYITITVGSEVTRGKTVFVNAVTTWAAYNRWGGGWNVYQGPGSADTGDTEGPGAADSGYKGRSRKVSFDRPYDKDGSYFLWYELPHLVLAERMGLPLAYATDVDLDAKRALFEGAHALIFAGHDEYWSSGMRDTTLALRDAGTNIGIFGANTAYRHIRLEPSELGDRRIVVCYKHANEDPLLAQDPTETTQQWRLPPHPRPESELTGVIYESYPVSAPYVVVEPDAWVFQGTGAVKGSAYNGLVGVEYDRIIAGFPAPRPLQVLSDSPLTCRGVKTYSNSSYYTTPSGAGVFSTGSLIWSTMLPTGPNHIKFGAESSAFAATVTGNVLREFSRGPAGAAHPAVDNYDTYARPPLRNLPYTWND